MKLTRAAFAVIVKFSDLIDSITTLVDEVDMNYSEFEHDPEKDLKMRELIKKVPNYDNVFKRWDKASKMRQWTNEFRN